ncbi:MAG: alpha-amylase family glycosyl hydrolase [Bacteroidota bacterium]
MRGRTVRGALVWFFAAAGACSSLAGPLRVEKLEPPWWWVGMRRDTLQVLIYGENLEGASVRPDRQGVQLAGIRSTGSPFHVFAELVITPDASPGPCTLTLWKEGDTAGIVLPLLERPPRRGRYAGFSSDDVLYLITPDRFANGDPQNDAVEGYPESVNRSDPYGRHGGDITGIISRLDYLADLGVTALWINPLTENRGPVSYHGYAATDLYAVDPRFGSHELYARMVQASHERGLKVIMDHVGNHIGIEHPWVRRPPSPNWFHGTPGDHPGAYHGKRELTDPYSDASARERATQGWFTDRMPDLHHGNPLVRRYLIQNTLWWIESTGLDGIREDTFPYLDPGFASEWCRAVLEEYPDFNIVGEVWVDEPSLLAPYQAGSCLWRGPDPRLPSVTDFPLMGVLDAVFARGESISLLHEMLGEDFLFPRPDRLVTFLDNHDIQRFMRRTGGDERRFSLALLVLLTTRGIPQIYYGTEIGMEGGRDHGRIREDFPGGFPGDPRDAFTEEGRTPGENSLFRNLRTLLRVRREHEALRRGSLVHYPPGEDLYVYRRETEAETLLVAVNAGSALRTLAPGSYGIPLRGGWVLRDLTGGELVPLGEGAQVELAPQSGRILLLERGGD